MRRILEASLLLSTVLFTAGAVAGQTATDATASTGDNPDATGVIPAQVVYSAPVDLTTELAQGIPDSAEVVLKVNVDRNGMAHRVKVLDSDDPALNGPVEAAVRKYHFQPATLNDQAIPSELNLVVDVQH
jgi:TonB family protein